MPTAPLRIIDLSAPGLDGLLESLTSNIYQVTGERFMRNQSARRRWQFVLPSDEEGELFELQDLTGAVVEVGIGQPDVAATSGTLKGSFEAATDDLTALPWPITAPTLQTALNANSAIAAAGGVTVTAHGALFVITFVADGARARILWDTESIVPISSAATAEVQEGDVDTPSIQTLLISQQPYAYVSMSGGDIDGDTASGTLVFNRLALLAAFANTTADSISAQVEIRITWPSEAPDVVYRGTALIHRDILQGISGLTALPPSPYPGAGQLALNLPEITGLTGGGADELDGIDVGTGLYVEGLLAALNVDAAPLFWRLRTLEITAISAAAAAVVTTSKPHGLVTDQTVAIGGSDSTPTIDGDRVVTVLSDTTFSVPFTTTVVGTEGFATPAEDAPAGLVRPDNFDPETNPLYWQSRL